MINGNLDPYSIAGQRMAESMGLKRHEIHSHPDLRRFAGVIILDRSAEMVQQIDTATKFLCVSQFHLLSSPCLTRSYSSSSSCGRQVILRKQEVQRSQHISHFSTLSRPTEWLRRSAKWRDDGPCFGLQKLEKAREWVNLRESDRKK